MNRVRLLLLLLAISLGLSARNQPTSVSARSNLHTYTDRNILTEDVCVSFSSGARSCSPFSLQWTFSTPDGTVLNSDSWEGQFSWGTKTNAQQFAITLPTDAIGDCRHDHTIIFRCRVMQGGKEVCSCTNQTQLKGRRARLQVDDFVTGSKRCRINYRITEETVQPRVDLYVNDTCVVRDYRDQYLTTGQLAASPLARVPQPEEPFIWQLRAYDPDLGILLDESTPSRGCFAPVSCSAERVSWSYTSSEMTITIHGLRLRHAGEGVYLHAALYDSEQYGSGLLTEARSGRYTQDGYYAAVSISLPLKTLTDARRENVDGELFVRYYDGNEWRKLHYEPARLIDLCRYDPNTIFHSDNPFFNRHDGIVLLHITSDGCRPCLRWIENIYHPNADRWRELGVTILYYDLKWKKPLELPGAREVDKQTKEEIIKLAKGEQYSRVIPSVFVFDGFGNCVYADSGCSDDTDAIQLTADELNRAITELYNALKK